MKCVFRTGEVGEHTHVYTQHKFTCDRLCDYNHRNTDTISDDQVMIDTKKILLIYFWWLIVWRCYSNCATCVNGRILFSKKKKFVTFEVHFVKYFIM